MSRVPVSWSMMPAAMNREHLKVAWFRMWNTRRHDGQRLVQPEQQRDQAELADGGIGEQPLEVVLEERQVGTDQQRSQAGQPTTIQNHDVAAGQGRVQSRQQEHAGLHHRGRVQVRRYRRRRGHRVGQPEVERELRALGEGAQQYQHQRRQIQRMGAQHVARRSARCRARSLPTMWLINSTPASRHSPPALVTASAMRAPSRASARWCQ